MNIVLRRALLRHQKISGMEEMFLCVCVCCASLCGHFLCACATTTNTTRVLPLTFTMFLLFIPKSAYDVSFVKSLLGNIFLIFEPILLLTTERKNTCFLFFFSSVKQIELRQLCRCVCVCECFCDCVKWRERVSKRECM